MRTNYSGAVGSKYTSLPCGDGYTATINTSGADQDNGHYAGLDRDAESGTEHAQFRNYASAQGRWLAPDPYMGSYDLTNPQSMNRYAYALNNPTSLIDPSGLDTTQPVQCGTDAAGNPTFCMTTVNGPAQPGNWCGGAAWGTEGCIAWPCWMISACASQPSGPDPSGGAGSSGSGSGSTASNLGPSRFALLSAPNNGPTKGQCLGQALKSDGNGVSLALDVAGLGAGFLQGGGLVTAPQGQLTLPSLLRLDLLWHRLAKAPAIRAGPGSC
jgi:RHS repeat-associated protein